MSTPATIKVFKDGFCVVSMHCHSDGYFHGIGLDLAKFLSTVTMVNGISSNDLHVANGMGDLAAQVVCHFKQQQPGDFYLVDEEEDVEDFFYTVRLDDDNEQLTMAAWSVDHGEIYSGRPAMFDVRLTEFYKELQEQNR